MNQQFETPVIDKDLERKVRQYVKEHPGCTVGELAVAFPEVPKIVLAWIIV